MLIGSRGRDKALRQCEPGYPGMAPQAVGEGLWSHAQYSPPVRLVCLAFLVCLVYLVCLVCLVFWLNETNQMNQINQINKTNQIDPMDSGLF